jgi:hypothetical protein
MITLASIGTRAESIQNWTPENTRQTCLLRCEEANRFEEVVKARRKPTPVAQLGGRSRNKETIRPAFKSNLRQKYCTEKETTCSRTEKAHLQRKTSSKKLTRVHRNQILSDICCKTGKRETRQTTHFILSLSLLLSPTPFLIADLYTSY